MQKIFLKNTGKKDKSTLKPLYTKTNRIYPREAKLFNIRKPLNIIHHNNRMKEKNDRLNWCRTFDEIQHPFMKKHPKIEETTYDSLDECTPQAYVLKAWPPV